MKVLVLFTLFFMSLSYVTAKEEVPFSPIMSARLDRCTSYCNPKYCKIKTVCRPLNRTSKFISMDIYLHRGVKLEAPVNGHRHTQPRISNVYDYISPIFRIVPAGDWRIDVVLSADINGSEVVVVSWNDYYEVKSLTAEEF